MCSRTTRGPAAFAVDARVLDGSVRAVVTAAGSLVGVIIRRVSPRVDYAAFYDAQENVLSIVRRTEADLVTLASTPALVWPATSRSSSRQPVHGRPP